MTTSLIDEEPGCRESGTPGSGVAAEGATLPPTMTEKMSWRELCVTLISLGGDIQTQNGESQPESAVREKGIQDGAGLS
jgi:hypothetical protein